MSPNQRNVIVSCAVFTAIGLVGGWTAARQSVGAGHSGSESEKRSEDDSGRPDLPPETLRNLGVEVERVQPTTFVQYRSIPAVISRTPFNERPVVAPIGGRIREIFVEPGMLVRAGDTLLTLVREPIQRPTLDLTEEILKPARESIHSTVVDLRRSLEETRIFKTELDRVSKFTGSVGGEKLPILPRQTAINLRNQLLRAKHAFEQARLELDKHGFTNENIDAIAAGGSIPDLGKDTWKRALERNGMWTEMAQQLHDVISAKLQSERWTIATIGELAAAGLVKDDLIAWLKEEPDGCEHFLEIGALLQKGYSVEDLRVLHDLDAFEPVVRVRAPGTGVNADWDVVSIDVQAGAVIKAGTRLITLLDPRILYLKTEPVGAEKADVLGAVGKSGVCQARPLVKDSAPILEQVTIGFVTSETDSHGTVAFAKVRNEVLAVKTEEGARTLRSWRLRAGLKYLLRVPVREIPNAYVVPSDAIADDGPHKVLFLVDGDSFKPVRVAITYRDEEVAVIASDKFTALFPGDPVVVRGAYALSLALRSGSNRPDPHAGHSHD